MKSKCLAERKQMINEHKKNGYILIKGEEEREILALKDGGYSIIELRSCNDMEEDDTGYVKSEESPYRVYPYNLKGEKIVPNFERNKYSDKNEESGSEIYEYAVIFANRIGKILAGLENPQEILTTARNEKDDFYTLHIKHARDLMYDVAQAERSLFFNKKKFWTKEKRLKYISVAHSVICVIEKWDKLSNELKILEELEKKYKKGESINLKYYNNNVEDLWDKAVRYYNEQNGELEIN